VKLSLFLRDFPETPQKLKSGGFSKVAVEREQAEEGIPPTVQVDRPWMVFFLSLAERKRKKGL